MNHYDNPELIEEMNYFGYSPDSKELLEELIKIFNYILPLDIIKIIYNEIIKPIKFSEDIPIGQVYYMHYTYNFIFNDLTYIFKKISQSDYELIYSIMCKYTNFKLEKDNNDIYQIISNNHKRNELYRFPSFLYIKQVFPINAKNDYKLQ